MIFPQVKHSQFFFFPSHVPGSHNTLLSICGRSLSVEIVTEHNNPDAFQLIQNRANHALRPGHFISIQIGQESCYFRTI